MALILASASPRRQELIQLLGLPWRVVVAQVDESSVSHPDPAQDVIQTARLKAADVVPRAPDGRCIHRKPFCLARPVRRLAFC